MKIYQILQDGVEGGYVHALHGGAALAEAQRVIEGWGKQYGPLPPQWQLETKEMHLWDILFYTGSTPQTLSVGASMGVLAYSEEDARKRAPNGYCVYGVKKSKVPHTPIKGYTQ